MKQDIASALWCFHRASEKVVYCIPFIMIIGSTIQKLHTLALGCGLVPGKHRPIFTSHSMGFCAITRVGPP